MNDGLEVGHDVQGELPEEAADCLAAKEAVLGPKTDEKFDVAKRTMEIFCND